MESQLVFYLLLAHQHCTILCSHLSISYRKLSDGNAGPAEKLNLVGSVGDKIIAVNGVPTANLIFKEVIELLRNAGKYNYAHMRFLRSRFSTINADLSSCGNVGAFMMEDLTNQFRVQRRQMLTLRSKNLLDATPGLADIKHDDDDDNESVVEENSDDDSSSGSDESDGEFEEVSDDDEVVDHKFAGVPNSATINPVPNSNAADNSGGDTKMNDPAFSQEEEEDHEPAEQLSQRETTRSLALRLLDIDVGYSSDEGGEEEGAYYLDGVDARFKRATECYEEVLHQARAKLANPEKKRGAGKELMKPAAALAVWSPEDCGPELSPEFYRARAELPAKRNEFANLGGRAKLCASVLLTREEPREEACLRDYGTEEPTPEDVASQEAASSREESEAQKQKQAAADQQNRPKSATKIEQIDPTTSNVLHVWPSVKAASMTLQLPLEELESLLSGEYNESVGDEVGGFRWRFADADAVVTTDAGGNGSSSKSKLAYLEFKDKLYNPNKPHSYKNNNKLRDYQVDGVNWLASCWYKRHNAILADEMGLGKTVQIVAYLEHIHRVDKIKRPFLVVVPLSTVEHWRREFEGWTDMECCVYHDRQRIWRDVSREYEWYYEDRPHTPEYLKFDVLVTTYDTLIADIDIIGTVPFRVSVVDEAHR